MVVGEKKRTIYLFCYNSNIKLLIMNKYIIFIAMLNILPAFGQEIVIENTESYIKVIPHQFTVNNKPILHIQNWDGEKECITLYNDDIEKIEDIIIYNNNTFDYTLTYMNEKREVEGISKKVIYESYYRKLNENYTFEDFIREESFYGKIEYRVEDGDTIVYQLRNTSTTRNSDENNFFGYEHYGTKYPLFYILCRNNVLYQIRCRYEATYSEWIYAGEEKVEYSCNLPVVTLDYDNFDEGNTSYNPDDKFVLTQTLFNNDEKFEYIIPKAELSDIRTSVNVSPEVNEEQLVLNRSVLNSDKTNPVYIGFQVLSSDGITLHDISFGNGFWMDEYDCNEIKIITLGGKDYLVANGHIKNDTDESINSVMFYRINRQTNSLDEIKSMPANIRVKQHASTINIQLSDKTSEDSEIIMTNSAGVTIARKRISKGEHNTTIRASLPKGVYNITRFQHGEIIENMKVIIK